MNYQTFKKKYRLPDAPGVYFFLGPRKRILYIGRATSLRDRVRSYFGGDIKTARGPKVVEMVEKTVSVDWQETDSVLEALLLEAHLIKKHAPPYNTEGKDDKSFNHLIITDEEFPRVLVVRGRDIFKKKFSAPDIKYLFGPFPKGGVFKEALTIIRKIFPFRDHCTPEPSSQSSGASKQRKPCFNRQIGLCPGVCTGEITKREYAQTIHHLKLFFEGKKKTLIKKLEREMRTYAKKQEFEKAARMKRTIFALNHIQDVALLKQGPTSESTALRGRTLTRIEGYDIAHLGGAATVGVMTVIEGGEPKKSAYRRFRIKGSRAGSDTDALKEVLRRRLAHAEPAAVFGGSGSHWPLPGIVVVDGGKQQIHAVRNVLAEYGYQIPIVSVVKNEHHRPREILGDVRIRTDYEADILLANAEAHRFALAYHRKLRRQDLKPSVR